MKTLIRGFAATLLFLATVRAFATDPQILEKFPVGNEDFFRKEGSKLVAQVSVLVFHGQNFGDSQVGSGKSYSRQGVSDEALPAFGKTSVANSLANCSGFFQKNPEGTYLLSVSWGGDETSSIPYGPFYHEAHFELVNVNGTWQPPTSVVNNVNMSFGNHVFIHLPGALRTRTRWLGKDSEGNLGFQDESYPNFAEGSSVRPLSLRPQSTAESDIFAIPTEAMFGGLQGIQTVVYPNGSDETFVRYFTSTGAQLPGVQVEREPLLVAATPNEWGALTIKRSGDLEIPHTFDRSANLTNWREIVNGKDGVLDSEGMTVIPEGVEFFRARYRQ